MESEPPLIFGGSGLFPFPSLEEFDFEAGLANDEVRAMELEYMRDGALHDIDRILESDNAALRREEELIISSMVPLFHATDFYLRFAVEGMWSGDLPSTSVAARDAVAQGVAALATEIRENTNALVHYNGFHHAFTYPVVDFLLWALRVSMRIKPTPRSETLKRKADEDNGGGALVPLPPAKRVSDNVTNGEEGSTSAVAHAEVARLEFEVGGQERLMIVGVPLPEWVAEADSDTSALDLRTASFLVRFLPLVYRIFSGGGVPGCDEAVVDVPGGGRSMDYREVARCFDASDPAGFASVTRLVEEDFLNSTRFARSANVIVMYIAALSAVVPTPAGVVQVSQALVVEDTRSAPEVDVALRQEDFHTAIARYVSQALHHHSNRIGQFDVIIGGRVMDAEENLKKARALIKKHGQYDMSEIGSAVDDVDVGDDDEFEELEADPNYDEDQEDIGGMMQDGINWVRTRVFKKKPMYWPISAVHPIYPPRTTVGSKTVFEQHCVPYKSLEVCFSLMTKCGMEVIEPVKLLLNPALYMVNCKPSAVVYRYDIADCDARKRAVWFSKAKRLIAKVGFGCYASCACVVMRDGCGCIGYTLSFCGYETQLRFNRSKTTFRSKCNPCKTRTDTGYYFTGLSIITPIACHTGCI